MTELVFESSTDRHSEIFPEKAGACIGIFSVRIKASIHLSISSTSLMPVSSHLQVPDPHGTAALHHPADTAQLLTSG